MFLKAVRKKCDDTLFGGDVDDDQLVKTKITTCAKGRLDLCPISSDCSQTMKRSVCLSLHFLILAPNVKTNKQTGLHILFTSFRNSKFKSSSNLVSTGCKWHNQGARPTCATGELSCFQGPTPQQGKKSKKQTYSKRRERRLLTFRLWRCFLFSSPSHQSLLSRRQISAQTKVSPWEVQSAKSSFVENKSQN